MVKYLGRKGVEVNGKKKSIDIKVLKDNFKVEQTKKNSCSKYFWKLLFLKNSNRKWLKETQIIRILLVRYDC